MPVTKLLTPSAVNAADYPVAQTPLLGGELQVYITTKSVRVLGSALLADDGVISYKYYLPPSGATPGPIAVVAVNNGVLQKAADVITFAGLTGSFSPVGWTSNQTFDFPVGRAVELTGNYVAPTSSSVPTLTQVAGSGMLRGSQFVIMELPLLTDFVLAGCTTDRNVTIPTRASKSIACGLNASEWTTPGMTSVGELEITGLNQGMDDGLMRFAGVKCQAMVVPMREGRIITARSICTDWTGSAKATFGTGDSEASVSLSGAYSKFITFPAP